jgi:hypothetical protein
MWGIDIEIPLTALLRAVWVAGVELYVSVILIADIGVLTVRLEQVKHQFTSISMSMVKSYSGKMTIYGRDVEWDVKSRLTFLCAG